MLCPLPLIASFFLRLLWRANLGRSHRGTIFRLWGCCLRLLGVWLGAVSSKGTDAHLSSIPFLPMRTGKARGLCLPAGGWRTLIAVMRGLFPGYCLSSAYPGQEVMKNLGQNAFRFTS